MSDVFVIVVHAVLVYYTIELYFVFTKKDDNDIVSMDQK